MFDLPTMTKAERRAATLFRQGLLDRGYLMIQFSVYARPCITRDQLDSHVAKLKEFVPRAGNIRVIFLTDRQWERSYTVIGGSYADEQQQLLFPQTTPPDSDKSQKRRNRRANNPQMPNQVEFWE